MEVIYYLILVVYCAILVYILVFNLLQLELFFFYRKSQSKLSRDDHSQIQYPDAYPSVTVQLPLYNEKYVVARLIDNICTLQYPREKLQIQVLDDSTDESLEISKKKVAEYQQKGLDIQLITRTERKGFKAGALQHGLQFARGELIAIFDADFLPDTDFLLKVVPSFHNPRVGIVQARWEHLNQNHSLLTKVQALQLNVHFFIEQLARYEADYFLQFNGTAGIWRKSTILEAGGWQADTLTEDLDLSYRAQLHGWKILFREDVGSPAELPTEIWSYKSQQFRWMKGGAETARKLLPILWRSKVPFWKKVHATGHLAASSIFVMIFLMALLSVPMVWVVNNLGIDMRFFLIFGLGITSIALIFYQANVLNAHSRFEPTLLQRIWKFILIFPAFMAISMGLSLHNTRAVIQGLRGKKSPFIRTPKFHLHSPVSHERSYAFRRVDKITWWEGFFCVYFIFGIGAGLIEQQYSMIVLHGFLAVGFGLIFYYSVA